MPRALGLAVLASACPLAAAAAQAAEWRVDSGRSAIAVVVSQSGKPFEARFARFDARVTFDPARPEAARVAITVDTASFASGDRQRDGIATSQAFLAARDHPQARYTTRSLRPLGGDRYEVEADLELRGVARSLTHTATITAGPAEARATGEVELARLDWQVGQDQPRDADVGTVVTVRFDLAATPAGG